MSKDIVKTSARTEVGAFDDKLLRGAANGLSPVELSRRVGGTLSPAECAVRVREILNDKAFWGGTEKKQLLLYQVQTTVEELATISKNSGDSQDYSTLVRSMDLLRKVLGEMEGATEEEMRAMVRMQAEDMFNYVEAIMARARKILEEEHPEFDPAVIEEAIVLAREDIRGQRV